MTGGGRKDCRVAAALALTEVIDRGRSLSTVLPQWRMRVADKDAALFQEIVYGTLRGYWRLDAVLRRLLHKPLKAKDADLRALLLAGLYQIEALRIPDHAAVATTVDAAARGLGKAWAKGLCNAVLRGYIRQHDALSASPGAAPDVRYAHPAWLVNRVRDAYPEHWERILTANNARPPMTLRVNARRCSAQDYLQHLRDSGIEARSLACCPDAVALTVPVDVAALPGFDEGRVSVQDGAAQLAAACLDLQPGLRILDACAAPGGKAAHILERAPAIGELVAVESDAQRLLLLRETFARLGLAGRLIHGDAADPHHRWWDGGRFHRILLDAPCSATGVVRRHPDIKVLRRNEDIEGLRRLQATILRALWSLLEPGGMLLYVTCSVLPEENWLQISDFMAEQDDAQESPLEVAWGIAAPIGRQILPGMEDMDGFYYARLRKRGATGG